MLREGYVDKMVRSARRVYAQRGRLVRERLSGYGEIRGGEAGMYFTLSLPASGAPGVIADAARARIVVPDLQDYCRTANRSGIVVGFGGVTDAELVGCIDVLEASLRRRRGVWVA